MLWPVLSPVPLPQHWPPLHSCLLVLPLDHLVVLPVLQVGGQLRVLSLFCPLPGSVALEEGGAAIRLRRGQGLPFPLDAYGAGKAS